MKKFIFILLSIFLFVSCKKEPVAEFEVTGPTAVGGELVFQNNSSHATSYLWDFGDNSTSTLNIPTHVFNKPGKYEVTLIATGDGGSASVQKSLSIAGTTYSFRNSSSYDLPQFCTFYYNGSSLIYFVEHGILAKGHETNVVIAHSPEIEAGFIDSDVVYIVPGPFLLINGQHNNLEITDETPIYSNKGGTSDNNLVEIFKNHMQKQ